MLVWVDCHSGSAVNLQQAGSFLTRGLLIMIGHSRNEQIVLLKGHGEGFSMFSTDNGRQGYAESKAGSIWGDSQSRAANMDHYTQLLQQGPAFRSSLDSRSSGGLFGGKSNDPKCQPWSLQHGQPCCDQRLTRQPLP